MAQLCHRQLMLHALVPINGHAQQDASTDRVLMERVCVSLVPLASTAQCFLMIAPTTDQ
jgi:hypothetical protein